MRRVVARAALALALLVCPAVANADVTVNTVDDGDDGQCQALPLGDCTFREAIKYSADGDTVTAPAGDYDLTGDGVNFGGHVEVSHDVTSSARARQRRRSMGGTTTASSSSIPAQRRRSSA
jgi:CSLREA domain-containing protein